MVYPYKFLYPHYLCDRNVLIYSTMHLFIFQTWRCLASSCDKAGTCSGYKNIRSGSEESLQEATAYIGPIR